jgi:NAD(P)-dependent dehydrogenase (short-subunit alcohol dehydrogenase family)
VNAAPTDAPVAIVTGGSRGIGRACVAQLVELGHRVVLSARTQSAVDDVIQASSGDGAMVSGVVADATDPTAYERVVEAAIARHGRVDVVIANAGIYSTARVADISLADLRTVLDVNLMSVIALAKAALPELARHAGYFVALGSISGTQGYPGEVAYGASKRALRILIDAINAEHADAGVRATLISPGWVKTDMALESFGPDEPTYILEPADVAQTVAWLLGLSAAARVNEIVLRAGP